MQKIYLRKCIGCNKSLPVSDYYPQSSGFIMSRCKKCYNRQCTERRQNSAKSRLSTRLAKKRWVLKNPDKQKKSVLDCWINLTDGVVASTLGLRLDNAPKPLIEAKRALLKLKKEIRNHEKH